MSRLSLLLAIIALSPAPVAAQAVDQYGDPLPPGALARLGTVRFRLPGHCNGIEFGRDGKTLVTTGGDGLLVWDVGTGKVIHRLANEEGRDLAHCFLAPDHKLVALVQYDSQARGGKIRLFEVATGRHVRDFGSHNYAALEFSPDGRRVAGYHTNSGEPNEREREDTIDVFDVATGGVVSTWKAAQDGVIHAIFTKDGKRLVTGGADTTIKFWDVESGKELRRLSGSLSPIGFVALSADEKLLAGIHQQATPPNQLPRHSPRSLPWRGENRIQVWNLETGKTLYEFVVERPAQKIGVSGITSAIFTPDGKHLISGGIDRKTRVWDLEKGVEAKRFEISSDWYAALSPDGRTLAAFDGACVRLLDVETGKEQLSQFDPHIMPTRASMMPDGRTVVTAGRREGLLDLWDAKTGKRTGQIEGGGKTMIYELTPDAEGKRLVTMSYQEGRLFVWDLEKRTATEVPGLAARFAPTGPFSGIGSLALAADGKTLAVGKYRGSDVLLLDAASGNVIRELPGHTNGARLLSFTNGGQRLVVCCADHTVRVWDLTTGKESRRFGPLGDPTFRGPVPVGGGPTQASYVAALSADGRLLAYGNDGGSFVKDSGSLALFDVESGRQLFAIHFSTQPTTVPLRPSILAISPNGQQIAWSGYQQQAIHLVEAATGKERQQLTGHSGGVYTLSFSGDGKLLVSASPDSTGLVWDVLGTATKELSDAKLAQAWSDLAGDDAARAWDAIKLLAAAREPAVALLAKELKVIPPIDAAKLAQLIAALDSDSFAEREKASAELAKLGELAGPALDKLLKGNPSQEAKLRAEPIAAKLGGPVTSSEQLRTLRALEALEYIGTPDAVQVIEKLAKGAAGARETEDARRAVARLKKRPQGK